MRRWFRNVRHALSAPALLGQTLREAIDEEREFNDALLARLATAQARLAEDARQALADWTAIERSPRSAQVRIAALRLLFMALLEEHSALQQRARPAPGDGSQADAAERGGARRGA